MTRSEAMKRQDEIVAKGYYLGWWYGTDCEKCCGVYPRLERRQTFDTADCFYQCEVCGKRTKCFTMPWLARDAWNRHEFDGDEQMSMLSML